MQTIVITGASSGIGKACAELYAKKSSSAEPVQLVLLARREDRLKEIQKNLQSSHVKVHVCGVDLQDESAIEKFVSDFKEILLKVDILINSAGLAKGVEPVHKAKFKDWQQMLNVNVVSLFSITHKLLPYFAQNKKGHIVNIGSVAGVWTYPGGAVYCATKAAVKSFSEGLRLDLMGTGVRVTNIEPGMVETEFSEVRLEDKQKAQQVYANMQPLMADDIAESVVWSTQQPKHINIQEMIIFPTAQAGVGYVHRN